MTSGQAKRLIEQAIIKAKATAAQQVLDEVTPFVPIAAGDLRRSGRVDIRGNDVYVVYGERLPYARRQFNDNLFHLGKRGQYKSIGSSRGIYSSRYRLLKRTGNLTRSRSRWFDAVLKSDGAQRRVQSAFVRSFRL